MRALSMTTRRVERALPAEEHTDADTEALFRSHAPFVARFLIRLGVLAEDLDDVIQEVFLVVHRNGGYARGQATKMTYLANIALRAAASWRRRDRTRRARWAELEPTYPSGAPGPVEVLEEQEATRGLQRALDGLEPELKSVLTRSSNCASGQIIGPLLIPIQVISSI